MQDSNNINLFNNYSLIYHSVNDKTAHNFSFIGKTRLKRFFSKKLKSFSNDDSIVFQYKESNYGIEDAFNPDIKHIQITNKGIITTY